MAARKPAEIKLLEGGRRHAPVVAGPKLRGNVGRCPSGDPVVQREWRRLSREWRLLLCPQDRDALLAYCRLTVQMERLWERVVAEGPLLDIPGDNASPLHMGRALRAWTQLVAQQHRMLTEFGATPASRTRVGGGMTISAQEARRSGPSRLLTGG